MVTKKSCWQTIDGFVFIFTLLAISKTTYCIEDYELDLYDLVEEVNGTFYEFMGLSQVSSNAIRQQ